MKARLHELAGLLDRTERTHALGIVLLLALAAGLEVLGLGAVVPFISVVANPGLVEQNEWLRSFYGWSGATDTNHFLLLSSVALVVFFLCKNIYLGWLNWITARFVFDTEARLSTRLLERHLGAPYAAHIGESSSEVLRVISSETSRVAHGILQPLMTLAAESLVFTLIAALLFWTEPYATVAAVGTLGIIAWGLQRFLQRAISVQRERRIQHQSRLFRILGGALGSVKETLVLGRQRYFVDALSETAHAYSKSTRTFTVLNLMPRLMIETLTVAGLMIVVAVAVIRGTASEQLLSILALFVVAALRLMPSATRMLSSLNSLRFYAPALTALATALAKPPPETVPGPGVRADVPSPPRGFGAVEINGLSFRHPDMEEWILHDLTLEIREGDSIAIVGPSGAGKSTTADLILGLLEPVRGRIAARGRSLHELGRSWQDIIGYVSQDLFILDDTIRANVAFAVPESAVNDARVWEALALAQLADKVRSLPAGLDSPTGERGANLSGGERQRLAIARALYHDPDVLVFDEATSALDTQTEREVSETMERLMGRKTVIIIAHRLSTVKRCDRVLFLEAGRVMGCDRFDALLETNGAFRDFVRGGL